MGDDNPFKTFYDVLHAELTVTHTNVTYKEKAELIVKGFKELEQQLAAANARLENQAKTLAIYADNDKLDKEFKRRVREILRELYKDRQCWFCKHFDDFNDVKCRACGHGQDLFEHKYPDMDELLREGDE